MSEVINFPKLPQPDHVKTPEQALQYVLDHLQAGDTVADNLVIAWSHDAGDEVQYRYLVGGDVGLSATVGLLEITKMSLMDD